MMKNSSKIKCQLLPLYFIILTLISIIFITIFFTQAFSLQPVLPLVIKYFSYDCHYFDSTTSSDDIDALNS
jgi:hypothetical protein